MKIYVRASKKNDEFTVRWKSLNDVSLVYDGERHTLPSYEWKVDSKNTVKIVPCYYPQQDEVMWDVFVFNRERRDPYVESFYSSADAMEFIQMEYENYII